MCIHAGKAAIHINLSDGDRDRDRDGVGADWTQQLHAAFTELTASHRQLHRCDAVISHWLSTDSITIDQDNQKEPGDQLEITSQTSGHPSLLSEIRSSTGHQKLVNRALHLAPEDQC